MADYVLSAKITGDPSDFEDAFKKAEKTATSFSTKMKNIGGKFQSTGKSITKFGNSLTSHITKPALIAGTALAGVTLKKGWDRMSEIDNAKVKLEAIGNTADDVKEIMNNANASVKGTAYGLNEAASTAASAVAAGIQPGKELEKYLTAVADAAAVAGIDMGDMGSIFNKVTTQGKASNEILQQMAERGIPIYQYLADAIGVTADEVFDMASRGEIDLATFQKAVEEHIGGAAKTIGSKTISGAIANMGASISRIGANFLGSADDANSFAGQVLPLLNDFTEYLGGVEEKAKEWGATFGEVMSGIVDYCRTGKVNFQEMSDTAASIVGVLTPIIDIVKFIADAFGQLPPSVQAGLGIGILLAGPLISFLGKIVTGVGTLITIFGFLITPAGGVVLAIMAIVTAGLLLAANWDTIKAKAGQVWDWIKDKFAEFASYITGSFSTDWSKCFGSFGDILNGFFANVSNVWDAIKRVFHGIVDFVSGVFTGNWSRAWQGVVDIFGGIMDGLGAVIKAPLNAVISLVNGAIGAINGISVTIPKWVPKFGGNTFGVNIPKISYLLHGTDDWRGGFARMNEGGRGELVNLPSGAQVIPHDISVKYAKESARINGYTEPVDMERILEGVVIQITNNNNLDGTPLKKQFADYTIKRIGNTQKAKFGAMGAF